MTLGMIVAMTRDRVIGLDGKIPWHHPADLKRFKRLTVGHTVIMGRLTWLSLPKRPLVDRRNIVIATQRVPGVDTYANLTAAWQSVEGDAFIIGGARLYEAGLAFADFCDVTWVPETIDDPRAIRFPELSSDWLAGPEVPHPDDPALRLQRFDRAQ
jgi:dihydrofolate reductase